MCVCVSKCVWSRPRPQWGCCSIEKKYIVVTNLFASNKNINSSTHSLTLVTMNYCVIDDNISFDLIMNQNCCVPDKTLRNKLQWALIPSSSVKTSSLYAPTCSSVVNQNSWSVIIIPL